MAKPVVLATLVSAALLCLPQERANAISILSEVTSPRDCDTYLKITSKPTKQGLIEFIIRIRPEEAAHAGELYRGRVKAIGHLTISSADAPLATMLVHQGSDKESGKQVAEYRFELSRQLAKYSIFSLSLSLFEKNGMSTIGGGHAFKIHLDGFLPGDRN
jgi:hypothetical protein